MIPPPPTVEMKGTGSAKFNNRHHAHTAKVPVPLISTGGNLDCVTQRAAYMDADFGRRLNGVIWISPSGVT